MKIVWDEPKRLANIEKHGFDFADLDNVFFERAAIGQAKSRRRKAVGLFRGSVVTVIFSLLGREAMSIVGFRPAGAKERKVLR